MPSLCDFIVYQHALVSGGKYFQYQQISRDNRYSWLLPNPNAEATIYLGHVLSGLTEHDFYVKKAICTFSDTESYSFGLVAEKNQESMKVYVNNTKINEIDLTPFAENLKEKFRNFKDSLPPYSVQDEIITALTLQMQAINIEKNGNIEYYVFGSIHGYFDVRYFIAMIENYNGQDLASIQMWLPCGSSCLYNSNQEILSYHSYGGLKTTAKYPIYRFVISDDGKVIGDTTQSIVKEAIGDVEIDFSIKTSNFSNDVFFQAGDGSCKLSKYGLASFYDSQNKIIAENVVVDDDYLCVEIDSYDTDKLDIFTGFTVSGLELNVKYKIYTPDGKINEKEADLSSLDTDVDADGVPLMDGYYTRGTNGELTPFYFKPILKKLSDTVYLFGTHGGKLYIKTASGIQEVGDGLKNFRLELLNDISKARG